MRHTTRSLPLHEVVLQKLKEKPNDKEVSGWRRYGISG
jgi:hypothetical protein